MRIEGGGKLVKSCKYTAFGLSVKMELLRQGKSQKWLEDQIRLHTGLYVDDSYISKILTGQRNAPKIVHAIREILDLPEQVQE